MNCICAPPLAKQCIELYTGINLKYMMVDYLGLLHKHVHVHYGLVPRLLPSYSYWYKKKQCWEGVYERGVA